MNKLTKMIHAAGLRPNGCASAWAIGKLREEEARKVHGDDAMNAAIARSIERIRAEKEALMGMTREEAEELWEDIRPGELSREGLAICWGIPWGHKNYGLLDELPVGAAKRFLLNKGFPSPVLSWDEIF